MVPPHDRKPSLPIGSDMASPPDPLSMLIDVAMTFARQPPGPPSHERAHMMLAPQPLLDHDVSAYTQEERAADQVWQQRFGPLHSGDTSSARAYASLLRGRVEGRVSPVLSHHATYTPLPSPMGHTLLTRGGLTTPPRTGQITPSSVSAMPRFGHGSRLSFFPPRPPVAMAKASSSSKVLKTTRCNTSFSSKTRTTVRRVQNLVSTQRSVIKDMALKPLTIGLTMSSPDDPVTAPRVVWQDADWECLVEQLAMYSLYPLGGHGGDTFYRALAAATFTPPNYVLSPDKIRHNILLLLHTDPRLKTGSTGSTELSHLIQTYASSSVSSTLTPLAYTQDKIRQNGEGEIIDEILLLAVMMYFRRPVLLYAGWLPTLLDLPPSCKTSSASGQPQFGTDPIGIAQYTVTTAEGMKMKKYVPIETVDGCRTTKRGIAALHEMYRARYEAEATAALSGSHPTPEQATLKRFDLPIKLQCPWDHRAARTNCVRHTISENIKFAADALSAEAQETSLTHSEKQTRIQFDLDQSPGLGYVKTLFKFPGDRQRRLQLQRGILMLLTYIGERGGFTYDGKSYEHTTHFSAEEICRAKKLLAQFGIPVQAFLDWARPENIDAWANRFLLGMAGQPLDQLVMSKAALVAEIKLIGLARIRYFMEEWFEAEHAAELIPMAPSVRRGIGGIGGSGSFSSSSSGSSGSIAQFNSKRPHSNRRNRSAYTFWNIFKSKARQWGNAKTKSKTKPKRQYKKRAFPTPTALPLNGAARATKKAKKREYRKKKIAVSRLSMKAPEPYIPRITFTKSSAWVRCYKGSVIQPTELWNAVQKVGGVAWVERNRKWQSVREEMGLIHSTSSGATLKKAYTQYFENPGHFLSLARGAE